MKKIGRRLLSLLLCMAMVLSIMPGVSLADSAAAAESTYDVTVNVEIPSDATVDAFFVYGPLDDGVTDATTQYDITQNADGAYTATVPTTGKYLVILSYSTTTTSGSSWRPNTSTTYYYGKQVFFVTKEQTPVAMAVEEVNISWTDAKEVYDETVNSSRRNYFDHIDVRVYGTLSTSEDNVLTTYNIKLSNARVTVTYPEGSTSGGVGFEASHVDNNEETYEWRATGKQIYEDAIVTLTCDILDNTTNEVLYEDFSISFSGEIEFTQAIINCDMNMGLDFIVSPTTIIEVIYNDVSYDWEVQGTDTDLNAALLERLNEIASVPATTTNYRVGALHTVDTVWTEGSEELICLENADGTESYYILTFHGWDEYTNEEGTYAITGETIAVNSDTTVSGYWTYQAYDAQNSITLTKTLVIPAGYEDYFDLSGMHLTVTKGTDTHLDITFSHMASHMANGAEFSTDSDGNTVIYLEYTLMLPVYTAGMTYTIVESSTDVAGFTCDSQITVDGQTLSTDGTSVAYAELPASAINTDLGTVNFTNTYAKPDATPSYQVPDLIIRKTDNETSQIMAGVVFSLIQAEYDEASGKWIAADGAAAVTATTTTQGVATFAALAEGAYLLQETITQENYILDDSVYLVQVTLKEGYPVEQFTDGQWINVYEYDLSVYLETETGYESVSYLHNYLPIGNQKAYGDVTVTKEFGSSVSVDSVVVNLLDADKNIVGTVTLDASNNWTHTFTDLEMGTYYVEEQIADKDGYTLQTTYSSESVTLTVSDPDAEVTITNTYIKQTGNLTITKQFGEGNQYVPGSVTIRVTGPNGFSQDVVLSADNNGTVTLTGLDLGTYTITELNAEVDGYKLETTYSATEVTVTNGATVSVTVTNTYTRQVGSLTVFKEFGSDARPDAIDIEVLDASGNVVRTATLSASNNWAVTFANLPLGTYSVVEVNAGMDGYDLETTYSASSVTLDATNYLVQVTITNTYTLQLGSLTIHKVFGSAEHPDSITVNVTGPNGYSEEVILNDGNNWTVTLEGLVPGTYHVAEESATMHGFDWTVTGGEQDAVVTPLENTTVTITNTYIKQTGNLTITKQFGEGNQYVPGSVTIRVTGPNGFSQDVVLSADNNGTVTLTGLDLGTYTITELNAEVDGYKLETTYSATEVTVTNGAAVSVTITNTYTRQVGSLTVEKTFGDGNQYVPESIEIEVLDADGNVVRTATLSESNNWAVTFANLPLGTYSVVEVNASEEGYNLTTTYSASSVTITATDHAPTVSIENTYTQITGDVILYKNFGDGNQYVPNAVTIIVLDSNENICDEITLSADNNGIAALNLTYGTYYIYEQDASVDGYDWVVSYTGGELVKLSSGIEAVKVVIDGSSTAINVHITNTYTQQVGSLTINKAFSLNNELNTDSLSVTMVVTGPHNFEQEITLNKDNNWTITLTNLPIGDYTVTEINAIVDGYDLTVEGNGSTATVKKNANISVTITNTYTLQVGKLVIEKVFGSTEHPESITVLVTSPNGYSKEVTLTAENGWIVTLEGLVPGEYTVTEKDASMDGYDWTVIGGEQYATVVMDQTTTVVITNTYVKQVGSLTIHKYFGTGNQYTPDSITVLVTGPNNYSEQITLTAENGWTETLTDLELGEYTVTEVKTQVDGYDLAVLGEQTITLTADSRAASVSITNTYTQQVGDLTVNKAFGKDNAFTPDSVEINVLDANGNLVGSAVLSDDNNWSFTFSNLPIGTYTVVETNAAVDGYNLTTSYSVSSVAVEQNKTAEVIVTNTYVQRVGSLTIHKNFGTGNQYTPESITVLVTGPNNYSQEVTLTAADGWTVTLEGLVPGKYTVTEQDASMDGYDWTVIGAAQDAIVEAEQTAAVTITNTYVKQVGSLTIHKYFGTGNQYTPDSITVLVTGPNNYSKEVTLTAANGWTETLTDLELGEYTIQEIDADAQNYDLTTIYSAESVTLDADSRTASISITNTYKKQLAGLTVEKIFGADNELSINSVTVIVTGPNGFSREIVLNAGNNWSVTLANLELGTYSITEKDASVSGYDWIVTYPSETVTLDSGNRSGKLTVSNTYTKQTGTLNIEKVFGMGTDYTPESVTVIVTGPSNFYKEIVLSPANGWAVSLTGLELGNYHVSEKDASVDGYDWTLNYSQQRVALTQTNRTASVVITNTYSKQVCELTISKTFGAGNKFMPESVLVMVYNEKNEPVIAVVLNEGNHWTVTITNLKFGTYTIVEKNANVSGYDLTTTYSAQTITLEDGHRSASVTVTNTYTEPVGSLTVEKVFGEGNDFTPESVTMVVTGPNGYSQEVVLNLANDWTATLMDLELGEYTVAEKDASVDGYNLVTVYSAQTVTVTEENRTASVTVTNTYIKHVGSLTVNKVFGEGNAYTPESVTMVVTGPNGYSKEVVLNAANGWSVTLENLDLGNYTVAEKNAGVDGYDLIAEGTTSVSVEKDGHAVITITNTYIKHVGSLTVEKIFGSGNTFLPESVTMVVTGPNGYSEEVVLNAANGWSVTLENLELGEYTVTEKDASVNGYDLTVEGSGSTATVTKDANVSVAITNTYIKHVGSLTVNKVFGESNTFLPESVTMIVTGPNGYSKEVVLNAANGWSVTLENLELGEYTVTEKDASVNGYDLTVEGSGSTATVTKDANVSVAITNTYIKQVGSLTVNKVFGEGNAFTPESVTMIVTGPNGYSKEVVLNAANGWSVTLENLELGEYTVTEKNAAVDGYYLTVNGSGSTVTVTKDSNVSVEIVNTYVQHVGSLTVNKIFGEGNAFTPEFVTVVVTGPNGYSNEMVLNAANGWSVTLENLALGEYTVTEKDASVNGYDLTVEGSGTAVTVTKDANVSVAITNTYIKQVGSLTVNKVFGEGNAFTPESVTMVITGPNGYSNEAVLNAANGWSVTLENLELGEYTVTEKDATVDGYSLVVTGDKAVATVSKDANTSVTITNTYTKDTSPDTADSDTLRMGLIILMIALCGMVAVLPHSKKENA